jgi:hypothetical protein
MEKWWVLSGGFAMMRLAVLYKAWLSGMNLVFSFTGCVTLSISVQGSLLSASVE